MRAAAGQVQTRRLPVIGASDTLECGYRRERLVNERSGEPGILLAALPPTPGQRRLALAIVLALLVAFVVMLPFARMELAPGRTSGYRAEQDRTTPGGCPPF